MKKLILFSVLLVTGFVAQAQKIRLALNPQEGQTCLVDIQANTTTETSVMGESMQTGSDVNIQMRLTVNAVEKKTFKITACFLDISSSVDVMGQRVSLSATGYDAASALLKELIGLSFQASVDRQTGKVISIEGGEEYFASIKENMEGLAAAGNSFVGMMGGFDAESMKYHIESCFISYPKAAVKIGQPWGDKAASGTQSGGMWMLVNMQYQVVGVNEGRVEIKAEGTAETDFSSALGSLGEGMSLQMDGVNNESIFMDLATGWVLERYSTMDIGGNAAVNIEGNAMNFPMNMRMRTTIKIQ